VFAITIRNEGDESREAIYSELWPWWVKGWLHEIQVRDAEQLSRGKLTGSLWNRHGADTAGKAELISDIHYDPSTPPSTSTTTLHLSLTLPPRSELTLTIPFTKLTLKYTEHRPDAERGVEIPSGTLTLLDLLPESDAAEGHTSTKHPRRSGRTRIYTNRLLLDVPTPDFSMPYNVIIMSSTVMAVFFGLMQGTLTRTWSYVQLPKTKS
jgi:phosphatidylinositol glycan class T